jgi:hypothetical protein
MVTVVVHSSSSSILLAATTLLDKTGELAISFNGDEENLRQRRAMSHEVGQDQVRNASMRKPP